MRRTCPFALALLLVLSPARAHGPVHEQIAALDRQLAADPGNAELLFKRGRLHGIHEDWQAALADFDRARGLDPELAGVDVLQARALRGAGRGVEAVAVLEALLERPETVGAARGRAELLLGETLRDLGRSAEAATAYSRALDATRMPSPDDVLAAARAHAALGPVGARRAVKILDQGMERLGPLLVLQREAVGLETGLGCFDDALARIDAVLEMVPRREGWLYERGRVLVLAGRDAAAREAFLAARATITALPERHRGTRAMRALAASINAALSSIR